MVEEKIKILVVEDDKFLRDLLVRKLEAENFEIMLSIDGADVLKKTKEGQPEIILLDLILPSVNGFDILAELKKDDETKAVPVVILSNLGQQEEVNKGLSLGAIDYLIKAHFTPEEIIEKIKKTLGK